MENEVDLNIQLECRDMFWFLLRHNYLNFSGMFGVVLSLGALALLLSGYGGGDTLKTVLLIGVAALFTIINPLMLWFKAAGQIKRNPMFKEPLHYKINSDGMLVSQGEEELPVEWASIRKVIETKSAIIVYLTVIHAYILPKRQFAEENTAVKEIIRRHVNAKVCRWKDKGKNDN